MRRAKPTESVIDIYPILLAEVAEEGFFHLFPVEMSEFESLTEPEPSIGGLVQLENGQFIGVCFGKQTHQLSILKPMGQATKEVLEKVFQEVPLLQKYVTWHAK